MPLADHLPPSRLTTQSNLRRRQPVWRGPEADGITYSLLCRFLVCRERFRILVTEGLKPTEGFNHRIEYGNMWHICEEAAAAEVKHFEGELGGTDTTLWEDNLKEYTKALCRRYPLQQEQIDHWYNVCKVQFPVYISHWWKHPDVTARVPLLQEQVFNVPYCLPSGRTVRLRGKWDSVDLIGNTGIYLQENKTKGDIDEVQLVRQLGSGFDLQTMLYLTSLQYLRDIHQRGTPSGFQTPLTDWLRFPLAGVRYNVVRRPLSGGKGTIVRHKPTKANPHGESKESYYARLSGIIKESAPSYFMRWKIEITPEDIARFRRECLDPILEQLCDWWEWIKVCPTGEAATGASVHWRHPFGVYNVLDEGGSSDLDEYMRTGSCVSLQEVTTLFPELE